MSANSTIYGSSGDDLLYATAGDDYIDGLSGRDTVFAGAGNDTLTAQPDDALLAGEQGDDLFQIRYGIGSAAGCMLTGGQGRDTFKFVGFPDFNYVENPPVYRISDFEAGAGGDILDLTDFLKIAYGYNGGNPFSAAVGVLRLIQNGNDTLLQWDHDAASSQYGFETLITLSNIQASSLTADNFTWGFSPDGSTAQGLKLIGSNADDTLVGTFANDTLTGLGGSDFLNGDMGNDLLDGGAGNDTLWGGRGDSTLLGGDGNDRLMCADSQPAGRNLLDGGNGDDVLQASGRSTLLGGEGNDWLSSSSSYQAVIDGGAGDDHLICLGVGGANNVMTGGTGSDVFEFSTSSYLSANWGTTSITDFSVDDTIDLTRQMAFSQSYGFVGGANPFSASYGYFKLIQRGADTVLQYDIDGAYGSRFDFKDALILQNKALDSLTSKNFGGLPPDGSHLDAIPLDGTEGADNLVSRFFSAVINGYDGDDTLQGSRYADTLLGGDGNDSLLGLAGADLLDGGSGNDTLRLEEGDTGIGGEGNDTLKLKTSFEMITAQGGTGDDIFQIEPTVGTVYSGVRAEVAGGEGRDTYRLSENAGLVSVSDFMAGANGDVIDLSTLLDISKLPQGLVGDNPFAAAANMLRLTQVGSDTYLELNEYYFSSSYSPVFNPLLVLRNVSIEQLTAANFGGIDPSGNPQPGLLLEGDSGNNQLTGSVFADTIHGGDGNDTIYGAGGSDALEGGAGADQIYAARNDYGAREDTLAGGDGDDTLVGGTSLDGGNGNDLLDAGCGPLTVRAWGGDGNDTITVSSASEWNPDGRVIVSGGAGNDVIKLGRLAGGSIVEVTDFSSGDRIDLLDYMQYLLGRATEDQYSGGSPFASGYLRVVQQGDDAVLVYKRGNVDQVLLVLKNVSAETLTADNFSGLAPDGSVVPGKVIVDDGSNWSITGTIFGDTITGGQNDGRIEGGGGNDSLFGGGGNDTLIGGAGKDTLIGGAGDQLFGGAGADTYVLLDAGAYIEATSLDTALVSYAGTYQLIAQLGHASAAAGLAINLIGNDLANRLAGNTLANSIAGGNGDDTLDGGGGQDTLVGGSGNDTYIVNNAGVAIVEVASGGGDLVVTSLSQYQLDATLEDLRYTGGSNFTGLGNASNNSITGGDGNDSLDGMDGSDFLIGGKGNDTLVGGNGDDYMFAGGGSDVLNCGSGFDYAVIQGRIADFTVTKTAQNEFLLISHVNGDQIIVRDAERIRFDDSSIIPSFWFSTTPSQYADSLTGTSGEDTLDGLTGADTMFGGAGNDTYVVDNAGDVVREMPDEGDSDTVLVNFAAAPPYVLAKDVENASVLASFTGAVNITGNELDNVIKGNAAANVLSGDAGNDTLDGGAGSDKLIGGKGDDTYYVDAAGDVVTELAGEGNDWVITSLTSYKLGVEVENLLGQAAQGFNGTGNALNNVLIGGSGKDTLAGLAGDDVLRGGGGADSLDGGAGRDSLEGQQGNDTLLGGDGDDRLDAGTADTPGTNGIADLIDGGAGNDSVIVAGTFSDYVRSRPNGTDTLLVNSLTHEHLTLRNVEYVTFADGLTLTMNDVQAGLSTLFNDKLEGTVNDDVMDGLAGADTMQGLAGNDTYKVDNLNDRIIEADGEGVDTVLVALTAAGVYQLDANVESATVTSAMNLSVGIAGNSLDNRLIGNDGANALSGGAGNDTLMGGKGSDKLSGGAGDDVYDVDATGDTVTELANDGEDTVLTSLASYKLGANVEHLAYNGSGASFNGTGNELANGITGSTGKDTLSGAAGNDTLTGNGGVDLLDGGAGDDLAVLAGARADYTVSRPNANDIVLTRVSTGEVVTLRGVENVQFSDTISGSKSLIENVVSSYADYLTGSSGSDTLNGGAGADTMAGGDGDDRYVVDTAADVIEEANGGGVDTVDIGLTSGIYTLAANIENAVVIGNASAGITGNALDNRLTGNAAANILNGGEGNDTIDGGAGSDKMTGGAGDDTYYVDATGDAITELANEGRDKIITSLATYTIANNVEDLQYTGTASFKLTGNAGGNVIQIANSVSGAVDGGAGNDTVIINGSFEDFVRTRPNATDLVLTHGAQVITLRNVESVVFLTVDNSTITKSYADLIFNIASIGNDILAGDAGDNLLDGGKGADDLTGGDGNDTYVVDVAGDAIHEAGNGGHDKVEVALASGIYALADNVEDGTVVGTAAAGISGNALDNKLTGNGAANTLNGGAGNDTLDGSAGSDKMAGGTGNDTYYVDATGDTITELANEGRDKVITALATYSIANNVEDLQYTGTASFKLTGNAGNNTIQIINVVSGVVDGAAGNDTVIINGSVDDFVRTRPNATDLVLTHGAQVITLRNVESVVFLNPADNSSITKSYADLIFNINSIGSDILAGDAGDNRLDGGKGADDMTGGDGNDIYVVDVVGDVIHEGPNGGYDKVEVALASGVYAMADNVEDGIVVGATAAGISGNALDNKLTGNGAANTLSGGDGNDTLIGGAGNDKLIGGAGNDAYYVDAAGDAITELAGEGNDIAYATSSSYTLSANVETLIYSGSSAFTGTGSADNNAITGGAANDMLSGMAGNDTLTGGAGNDTLTGGADSDLFIIGSGSDTIKDFATGVDKLGIALAIGNDDQALDGAEVRAATGGFSAAAELVVFTQNVSTMNAANAAATIGSANSAYASGATALFALHSGTTTTLFKFTSSGADAAVSAAELTQLATLTGVQTLSTADLIFA